MKRFYKAVTSVPADTGEGEGFGIALDGRLVKTPLKQPLRAPTKALAQAIQGEWEAQGDKIDLATMPMTQFLNSAIDRVGMRRQPVIDEVSAYGATDLLCYRADAPDTLVALQEQHWTPPLEWLDRTHGIRLATTIGVSPISQKPDALAALRAVVASFDDMRLMALHNATTVTGSVVLALSYLAGVLDHADLWAAAMVDEDFQISRWGEDAEAKKRRDLVHAELTDLDRWLSLI
ncbi:ATPase [Iodidimonas gelatinilytica]|uniref:ATPase n=1 Tax=Iodidimonas gelatinilytica TaxID=1236966 RepID=A0A5A7MV08_9PROT|nr:ATP12 family protein [Iodidimonas gelatinilytica]GEQ99153.1 ATPase [Iodidimonas gelatinilytica]GER01975.1 ATPase [Iodidimonas gelatinilytica]